MRKIPDSVVNESRVSLVALMLIVGVVNGYYGHFGWALVMVAIGAFEASLVVEKQRRAKGATGEHVRK